MTKKLSCLNKKTNKYYHLYAIKPLPKSNDEIQFFLFLYIHDIFESYYNLFLNLFNPSEKHSSLNTSHQL